MQLDIAKQFQYGVILMELDVLQASTHNAGTRLAPSWRTRIPALRQLIAAEQITGLYKRNSSIYIYISPDTTESRLSREDLMG